jgi:hypothetical protein
MSDLEDPEEAGFSYHHKGCICGRHRSQHEHDHQSRLQQQVIETCEAPRHDGVVVATAVMRKVFPRK